MRHLNKRSNQVTLTLLITLLILSFLAFFFWNKYHAKPETQPVAQSTDPLAHWITFSDPANRFSVLLPFLPSIKEDEYTATVEGKVRYSILVDTTQKAADSDKDLQTHVQAIFKNQSNNPKIIYADIEQDSNSTHFLDYKIQTDLDIIKGRIFATSKGIFILLNSLPKDIKNNDQFNAFISSFSLN